MTESSNNVRAYDGLWQQCGYTPVPVGRSVPLHGALWRLAAGFVPPALELT